MLAARINLHRRRNQTWGEYLGTCTYVMKGSFEKSMAEGRKLPAVFGHYIVPDATEGQLMAAGGADM